MNENIKRVAEEIKDLQQHLNVQNALKRDLLIALRKSIMQLSDLWLEQYPGHRGWRKFCKEEFGGVGTAKTFSTALTYACFERYCFSIPVGTLSGAFFFQSRIANEVIIRYSSGRGWKLNDEAVAKARSLWEKACEIAESELPTGHDLRQAIALSKGETYQPKSVLGRLQQRNQELEDENERLKQELNDMAIAQESDTSKLLESFRDRLKQYALVIEDTCNSTTQERTAFMLLLTQGTKACRKYLQQLRDANPKRRLA